MASAGSIQRAQCCKVWMPEAMLFCVLRQVLLDSTCVSDLLTFRHLCFVLFRKMEIRVSNLHNTAFDFDFCVFSFSLGVISGTTGQFLVFSNRECLCFTWFIQLVHYISNVIIYNSNEVHKRCFRVKHGFSLGRLFTELAKVEIAISSTSPEL